MVRTRRARITSSSSTTNTVRTYGETGRGADMSQNLRPGRESVRVQMAPGGVAFRPGAVPIRAEQLPAFVLPYLQGLAIPVLRCGLVSASACVLVATAYGQEAFSSLCSHHS